LGVLREGAEHCPQLFEILHSVEHFLLLRKDISGDSAFLAQHKIAILHIILLNDIL
jgi:hypothetical protein